MRYIYLVFIVFLHSVILNAQTTKERRVYYLDCSYSMITGDLWDSVCKDLKKAIESIEDQTTEIFVIPFAKDKQHLPPLQAFQAFATSKGKQELKSKIDRINPNKSSMTYHCVPIRDFCSRISNDRVTYMFLMTDGKNECNDNIFANELKKWGERYGDKNVYGFFVMLNSDARDNVVSKIISTQEHLWEVETSDVNINLVRLQSKAVFNARNDKSFELPICGKYLGMSFSAKFADNCPYHVKSTSIENGKLVVNVTFEGDVHSLPVSANYKMNVKMSGGGKFDFLVTNCINVKCESKPEKSLKVTVK